METTMSLRKLPFTKTSGFPSAAPYRGHQHFTERLLNRRSFLEKSGLGLGALVGAGLLPGVSRAALLKGTDRTTGATPVPIPGGTDLLGDGRIFHLFLPGTGAEPSTITDFIGFVGCASCSVNSSAWTGRTTTELSRLYDLTYSHVQRRTCKSMISIRG
ncbi:MAG: hypothetical protein DMG28_00635 [Acidobacteria bacterium]|nr:MAG: hypothetical protein DMG28_00635 [Acidobacteriota bacterium]